MPTIADIYRQLKEHEDLEKSAAVKKQAIASPQRGAGQPAAEVGAALEDVLGQNIAETKIRIKKKLEETAGAMKAVEGLSSDADDESPVTNQGPVVGDKMPPAGEPSGAGVAAKLSSQTAKQDEVKQAEDEKVAAEKVAAEYYAAGQIMAQGFYTELGRLMGGQE